MDHGIGRNVDRRESPNGIIRGLWQTQVRAFDAMQGGAFDTVHGSVLSTKLIR
jgi:hypothetical protein